jgi:hypothetical protein
LKIKKTLYIIKKKIGMQEIDRKDYTRVTTVLYPFSGLQNIDSEIVKNAGERGTRVHDACEMIMEGVTDDFWIEDDIEGYIDSFKHWWSTKPEVLSVEQRFWDDSEHITGQVDIITNTQDGIAIVDLKTSSRPSKTWHAQGSAYAMLAKQAGYDIKKIYFVHLNKTGKPPKIHEYPVDDLFLAVLRTYNHFYKGSNEFR